MVTQIQLGNMFQQNGRTVVGGSQSGIDTESLINGLVSAKRLGAVKLEDTNKTLDAQKSALTSLKTLLARFQTAVDTLRNPPGVDNASKNIFEYRTTTLSTNTGVSADNYMSVTVEPGTNIQNYTINEIHQLAQGTKQHTADFSLADTTTASVVTASGVHTAGLFAAGTFTMRAVDGGAAPTITLADGDSLQTVVNKFNDVKTHTGIQANIVKVASGTPNSTYEIVFSSTKTGTTYGFDLASIGTVTADADGVLSQITNQVNFGTTQTAQNAQFTIDGVTTTIERESNSVDDLIDGITFNLKQATPALTTISVDVQPDTSIISNAITQFADVYNEFRLFAAKQQELGDDGQPTEDAVLYHNSTLRNIIDQVAAEVTATVNGIASGDPTLLADAGITFDNFAGDDDNPATKNIMVVDTDALSSALSANFDGVRNLFEYRLNSDNTSLVDFARTNAMTATAFTLTIDRTAGTYEARDPNDNSLLATFDATVLSTGVSLKARAGGKLDGLELIYAADGDATIHVTQSQGFGDRLFNLMNTILDDDTGSLTLATNAVDDQETRNKDEITKIDDRLTTYRDQLVQQYADLEAALTKSNQLLQLLGAQSDARTAAGQ